MSSNGVAILLFCLCVFLSPKGTYQEYQAENGFNLDEEDGKVIVRIWYMTKEEFSPSERKFKDVTADIASQYCRKAKGNCRAEDKYIRSNDVIVTGRIPDDQHVQIHVYIRDPGNEDEAALADDQLARAYRRHEEDFLNEFGKPITVISPEEEHWEAWRIAVVTICACVGALALLGAAVIVKNAFTNNQQPHPKKGTGTHTPEEVSRHLQLYESVKEKRGDTATSYDNLGFTGDDQKTNRPQNGTVVYENYSEINKTDVESPPDRSSSMYTYVQPETIPTSVQADVLPQSDVTQEQTTPDVAGVYIEIFPDDHPASKEEEKEEGEYEDITYM